MPSPSSIVKSPLRAAILTVPSTSTTLNSVQELETGSTFTSPAVVPTPRDVEIVTAPCSRRTDEPWNSTKELANTVMLDPGSLILATESERVCKRSPEKIADEARGTWAPFTHAGPLV